MLQRLREASGVPFNTALANLYRDGRDSVAWHSDDEPELGAHPVIASLSLGATRRFLMRRKADHRHRRAFQLSHGSLLWMAGSTQEHWQHCLPKTARPVAARINLTFRAIGPYGVVGSGTPSSRLGLPESRVIPAGGPASAGVRSRSR
ncbi:DNA repair system specific for alkylated DNA [Cyanobium sp. PCC 7001]|uniref:alpha-ketoglutarate-dependent dioxygenase AlkB family protein n=1 Tax=Cyanobium sp. PCC 7001 TaxID=180281 RepID=UPI0001804EC4|nr:alpha-ketoglutarate-dependent dioxygenase AlkB [Cyanobium sp. PCC 7001]EDY37490.1 DNA repair system specific for alkylated DNA [Cyanobium sp. PCC 7001]